MSQFTPRNGKANYIKPRGKSYYYRRPIPEQFRSFFGGKTEWNIKLEAKTDAGRKAEAGALAHQHNKMMTIEDFDSVATAAQNQVDDTVNLKLDFSPENLPVNKQMPPLEFYRDGKIVRTYKIAGSNVNRPLFAGDPEVRILGYGKEELWQEISRRIACTCCADGSGSRERISQPFGGNFISWTEGWMQSG